MEVYAEYKDSGVEWFSLLPNHWFAVPFKTVLSQNDCGVWGDDPSGDEGDVIVLRSTEQTADGKWIIEEPAKRDLSSVAKLSYYLLRKGDLLVTKSSGSSLHIGKTTLVDKRVEELNCSYSNFMQRLRCSAVESPKFYWYVLNSGFVRSEFEYSQNSTSGLGNLNASSIDNLIVPWCPQVEQQAIADFLDEKTAEIDAIVEKAERSIGLLREYRRSVISEAVTKGLDPDVPMKDSGIDWIGDIPEGWVCQRLKTLASNRVVSANSESGKYLGLENIQSWTQAYVSGDAENVESGGILYDEECVMFGKLRPYLAKAYVPHGMGPCSSEFLTLVPQGIKREYLAYLLTSWGFIDEVNSQTYGVKMPRAGWDLIGKICMPCPPTNIQETIVDYLDAKTAEIDSLIADKERKVELLREYRKSLISEAVTGKFKVPGLE